MASALTVIGVKSQNLTRVLCLLKYFYHHLIASFQETSAYKFAFLFILHNSLFSEAATW